MSTVIPAAARFQSRKAPVSSLVRHPIHGLCRVLESRGWERFLECWGDGENPDVIGVDVRAIAEMNLHHDLGLA